MTANAKFNLNRIDTLASAFNIDAEQDINLRSAGRIQLRPEDASVGGSGTGGTVELGTSSQKLDDFTVNALECILGDTASILDTSPSGTRRLQIKYQSALSGSVDNAANRSLAFDLNGANRSFILGGDYSQIGGALALTLSGNSVLTLPLSGTLATLAGAETLTSKSIDADANTISNIRNANISAGAGIIYSKLALADSILNADINAAAAISYSKLELTNSIIGLDIASNAAIPYSKLDLNSSIINSDIHPNAALAYSKLDLTGSVVNADISASAGIAYPKLNLSNALVNADINSAAAIAYSKLNLANALVNADINATAAISYSKLALSNSIVNADISASAAIAYSKLALSNSVVNADISASAAIAYSKLALTASILNADIHPSAAIVYSKLALANSIVNTDVSPSAAIAGSKIDADFTGQTVLADEFEADLLRLNGPAFSTELNAASAGQAGDLSFELPPDLGLSGQVLSSDGTGGLYWDTVAGTGTVTSVGLALPASLFSISGSPVTASGTLTGSFATQVANRIFAGPATGADAAPTFRSLVNADLPALDTDDITEAGNLYFTDERAQDSVGSILSDSASIDFTYNDAAPSISAVLTDTTVTPGSYGTASAVSTITVDQKGRLTSAADTAISITSNAVTDFAEASQDAVGGILTDSASIDFTYNDSAPSISAVLVDTAVAPGTYGTANAVGTFTVDQKGRLTNAVDTPISITSAAVSDFNEAAQDAVGTALADSSSIDFTYTDGSNQITAVVLPAGVDHDALLNFVANEHIDHTSVSINTASNSGLAGGGTIAASRSLVVDSSNAPTVTIADADLLLFADASNSNALAKATALTIGQLAFTANAFKTTWALSDGATKVVTHNLGSKDILVQIYDLSNDESIQVDTVVRTDTNTLTLTASEAPNASGWRVLILKV